MADAHSLDSPNHSHALNESKQATHVTLPEQDPAAYASGTPILSQHLSLRVLRAVAPPLLLCVPGSKHILFWKGLRLGHYSRRRWTGFVYGFTC